MSKTKKYIYIAIIGLLLIALTFSSEYFRASKVAKAEEPPQPKVLQLLQSRDETEQKVKDLEKQKEEAEKKLQETKKSLEEQNQAIKEEVRVSASSSSQPNKETEVDKLEPIGNSAAMVMPLHASDVSDSILNRDFFLYGGGKKTGREIVDYIKSNPNGAKFYNAFFSAHGEEVANKAAIVLFYENGTLLETTTGVCSQKYQINGDYRRCVYSDMNSAGMDAGLNQVNTYYQRARIAKLGGVDCTPQNSRDIKDSCTAQQVEWLHNLDKNIVISLDIYAEQGFRPWVGYARSGLANM